MKKQKYIIVKLCWSIVFLFIRMWISKWFSCIFRFSMFQCSKRNWMHQEWWFYGNPLKIQWRTVLSGNKNGEMDYYKLFVRHQCLPLQHFIKSRGKAWIWILFWYFRTPDFCHTAGATEKVLFCSLHIQNKTKQCRYYVAGEETISDWNSNYY